MSRDLALHFSNKLAGEWSASSVTALLSSAVVQDLSTTTKWEALDPLVRVRLLLAPMFLRRQELTDLQPALVTLKAAADQDPDEWVRIVAAAVGPYDGVLHMDAVKEHSKLVRSTLEETRRHGTGADATLFRPLEEKYLSAAVMEHRLPGSTATAAAIPPHSHFTLRDASQAPGAVARPTTTATTTTATRAALAVPVRPPLPGLNRKPPMGPPRPSPAIGRRLEESNLFLSKKPSGGGGGGLLSRLGGTSAAAGGSRFASKERKKAAIIDINAVSELNQAAAAEKERQQREQDEAREAAVRNRMEAKKAEKELKEERKKREAAKTVSEAAAAKEAAKREKEAEKERKEAAAVAAKTAREEAKAAKEAEKEAAARRKAEEHLFKEAQRAARGLQKASRSDLKRSGGGSSSGSERPLKISKHAAAPTALDVMGTMAVLEAGVDGSAPLVELVDPAVALAALREAERLDGGANTGGGGYFDGGDDDEELDADILRYMKMAAEGGGGGDQQQGGGGDDEEFI